MPSSTSRSTSSGPTRARAASSAPVKEDSSIVTPAPAPALPESMLVAEADDRTEQAGRGGGRGRGRTAGRAQDLQAVHRGKVPADRVGPVVPGGRRRPGGPQGPARLGRGDRLQPRPDLVPGGRDAGGPPRPVRRRGRPGRGGGQ